MQTAFDCLLDAVPNGVLVVDAGLNILATNALAASLLRHSPGELAGRRLDELITERSRSRLVAAGSRLLAPCPANGARDREPVEIVRGDIVHGDIVCSDGGERPLSLELRRVEHEGHPALLVVLQEDGPLAGEAAPELGLERALRESEARHRALFEDSPVALVELDLSGTRAFLAALDDSGVTEQLDAHFEAHPEALRHAIGTVETVAMNQSALELLEANDATRSSEGLSIFGPDTGPWFRAALRELWKGGAHYGGETTTHTLGGAARAVSMRMHLLPGHTDSWSRAVVSLFDLTAHEQVEERLRSSLREKEVLLREVHHRVKNNLQIVSSLLNLKADTIENGAAQQVFADCQTRIRSLAFVHEHLYVASDLSHLPFGQYVRTLAAHLEHSFRAPDQDVHVRVAVGELNLSIDDAIPCGLIINELVTNSLKHAFALGSAGTIEIRMRRLPGHRLELSVADDGKGLPNGFNPEDSASGLDLVHTFAEQLGAEVEITRQRGTRFTFRFQAARGRATS
jgi:two-component sensor histidine kinase/PAS domain-containing protein